MGSFVLEESAAGFGVFVDLFEGFDFFCVPQYQFYTVVFTVVGVVAHVPR
jgi:hypothetical protein